jgi:hypothetical protein
MYEFAPDAALQLTVTVFALVVAVTVTAPGGAGPVGGPLSSEQAGRSSDESGKMSASTIAGSTRRLYRFIDRICPLRRLWRRPGGKGSGQSTAAGRHELKRCFHELRS